MKKICTKINIKLPFLTKTTCGIQSFRTGKKTKKQNLFSTKWDMIWSQSKNRKKHNKKSTFKQHLCHKQKHEFRFDTDRQRTCISFGTGSFMGQLDMTSSYEILAEEWNIVQKYMS